MRFRFGWWCPLRCQRTSGRMKTMEGEGYCLRQLLLRLLFLLMRLLFLLLRLLFLLLLPAPVWRRRASWLSGLLGCSEGGIQ